VVEWPADEELGPAQYTALAHVLQRMKLTLGTHCVDLRNLGGIVSSLRLWTALTI
jgi:hypothetical protein